MSPVKARRARENRAIVRKLLRQRQPEFAAALASAEHYFSCLVAERGDEIDVMIAHRIYHLDGRAVTCDLPKGHPGPHLHVETGWQY